VSELLDFLRGLTTAAERIDKVDRGETNPLKIVEAMLGESGSEPERWWHLFGLTERPERKAVLEGAWKRWAVRNHPDKGGDAISFGHMSATYKAMLERLPD